MLVNRTAFLRSTGQAASRCSRFLCCLVGPLRPHWDLAGDRTMIASAANMRRAVQDAAPDGDRDAWCQLECRYREGSAALNVVQHPVDRPQDLDDEVVSSAAAAVAEGSTRARTVCAAATSAGPGTAAYARACYEEKGYLPSLDHREFPSRLLVCQSNPSEPF